MHSSGAFWRSMAQIPEAHDGKAERSPGLPFAKTETAFVEHFSEHWPTMGMDRALSAGSNRCNARDCSAIGCPRHSQAVTKDETFVVCRLKSLDACAGDACPEASIGVALAAAGLPAPGEP